MPESLQQFGYLHKEHRGFLASWATGRLEKALRDVITRKDICIGESYTNSPIYVARSRYNVFGADCFWSEGSEYLICTDGVFLGRNRPNQFLTDLKSSFHVSEKKVLGAISSSRGTFRGLIVKKSHPTLLVFTDHISSKPVYYSSHPEGFVFSTEIRLLLKVLQRANGRLSSLSEFGARCLLAYGFMIGDETLVNGVKRIPPATCAIFDGKLQLQSYTEIQAHPTVKSSVENIVDEIDERFETAVRAEFMRDEEDEKDHILALSGGLDSRMTLLKGQSYASREIVTICYSGSGYREETISRKIGSNIGCRHLLLTLDGGDYLTNIEKVLMSNEGQTTYRPIAEGVSLFPLVCWDRFGLLHTGILGDMVLGGLHLERPGSFISQKVDGIGMACFLNPKNRAFLNHFNSKSLRNLFEHCFEEYANSVPLNVREEISFFFRNRGINGILHAGLGAQAFTEVVSPFLHWDFLEFALRLDPRIRYDHRIYLEWIARRCIDANKYSWETTGLPPILLGYQIRPKSFPARLWRFLRRGLIGSFSLDSRHPYHKWYRKNSRLSKFTRDRYEKNINIIVDTQLAAEARALFTEGDIRAKLRVLTLIEAIRYLGIK